MGFFSRLFGSSSRPTSTTPQQIGEALFRQVMERVRDHHAELQSMVSLPSATKEYLIGLTTFVLAPLEQVLSDVPMPELHAAKSGVREALMKEFKIQSPSQFTPVLNAQMNAYAQMARTGDLPTLGARAAESIGLDGNFDIETLLVRWYTSSLNFWLDALAAFGFDRA